MRSSIKIDFIDRGTGKGLEPTIRVELKKSEDPRDTLIHVLFESLRCSRYLEFNYSNHKHVSSQDNLPDLEKQILIFKPEIDFEKEADIHIETAKQQLLKLKEMIKKKQYDQIVPYFISFIPQELRSTIGA